MTLLPGVSHALWKSTIAASRLGAWPCRQRRGSTNAKGNAPCRRLWCLCSRIAGCGRRDDPQGLERRAGRSPTRILHYANGSLRWTFVRLPAANAVGIVRDGNLGPTPAPRGEPASCRPMRPVHGYVDHAVYLLRGLRLAHCTIRQSQYAGGPKVQAAAATLHRAGPLGR